MHLLLGCNQVHIHENCPHKSPITPKMAPHAHFTSNTSLENYQTVPYQKLVSQPKLPKSQTLNTPHSKSAPKEPGDSSFPSLEEHRTRRRPKSDSLCPVEAAISKLVLPFRVDVRIAMKILKR